MSKEEANPCKVMSPKFRVSFPALFKAQKVDPNDDNEVAKFAVTMLFKKGTNLKAMEKAVDAAIEKGIVEKWDGKKPKNLKLPFRDGDTDDNYSDKDGYPGHVFVRASSRDKPGVVNQIRETIDDPAEVYAGCYARATLVAFPYSVKGNKGVAFGLQNVQFLADGEAFSGRKKAEDDFEDYEDEDDLEEDDFLDDE